MKINCAHDELVEISKLVENPMNNNKHPQRQIDLLAKIIDFQGQRSPIVVSNRSGFIIKGHGRLAAIKKLGWDKAAVDYQDYESEAQEYADLTADNKIAELAEFDNAKFIEDLTKFEWAGDFDYDLLGIPDFKLPEKFEAQSHEDEIPEHVEPKSKLGDIYQLGRHRLMCGDSTSIDAVEKLMNGEKADFCFTSPPYSDQRDYNGNKELSPEHLAKFLMAPAKCFAVNLGMKREGGQIDPYWDIYITAAKSLGLNLVSWNIWNRQGFGFSIGNATAIFPIEHEFIFVFGNPIVNHKIIENKSAGRVNDYNGIRQKDGTVLKRDGNTIGTHRPLGTVLHVCQEAERTIDHPAKFPVLLPETYIQACSNEGSIIYEPFGGSGSTLIACEKTNRKCFMMELDPHYVDVIIARWEKYTGKKAELINGSR